MPRDSDLCVALAATHCSLRMGGEAALAFHHFQGLRRRGVDAHLVFHQRNEEEVRAEFPDDQERLHPVEDRPLHRGLHRLGKALPPRVEVCTTGVALLAATQLQQREVLRRLIRERGVQLVHQPGPVSPRLPSWLHGLGVPVVIGPMNGGMDYPAGLRGREGRLERLVTRAARRLSGLANQLVPGKRDAAALLVANARTFAALPPGTAAHVVSLPENGVDETVWRPAPAADAAAPGPFVYTGRLVGWKGVDLLLHAWAIARPDLGSARLDIIGDGPARPALEALARRLGLRDEVTFLGWRTPEECAARLSTAEALVLPSLLDCGGCVVLEAMALGRPVIAADHGGPRDYLDDVGGLLVACTSREALVAGFADALRRLHADPELRRRLGETGRRVVGARYTWSRKTEELVALYREVLRRARTSPGRPGRRAA